MMDEQGRIYVNFRIAGALMFVVGISKLFNVDPVNAMFITALIYLVPSGLIWIGGIMQGKDVA